MDLLFDLGSFFSEKKKLQRLAKKVYSYHNLGADVFPENEEKTPFGKGERYNFDRMSMMVSNYEFTNKHVMDLGCNSGWFCAQLKWLGSGKTVGIDVYEKGAMGAAIDYAIQFERTYRLGIHFINGNLETMDFMELAGQHGIKQFDVALVLSVIHHIGKKDLVLRANFFARVYEAVKEVIFYEDHEFWNELVDEEEKPILVKGEGYRFGWNEDMEWQRKIHSLESYEPKILDYYATTWRKKVLMMDQFSKIRFLGFSEKRRPMLALYKNK